MHHDPRQDGPDHQAPFQELRQNVNILLALLQIVSAPLEPWLRKPGTFGERYFGFHMACGLIAMLVLPAFLFPMGDMRPMVALLLATLFLMFVHRIKGWQLRRKGLVLHSRYSGTPWLPGDEVQVKTFRQPFLVMLAGGATCLLNPPAGVWMLIAGICLGLTHGVQQDADNARLRAMRDAQIEAEYYTARYREEARREE